MGADDEEKVVDRPAAAATLSRGTSIFLTPVLPDGTGATCSCVRPARQLHSQQPHLVCALQQAAKRRCARCSSWTASTCSWVRPAVSCVRPPVACALTLPPVHPPDCGWTDSCEPAYVDALARVAPRVDAVLLSHGDLLHLGALPAAFARAGLRRGTPVFTTPPVAKLGQLALYDLFAARHSEGEFDAFTLDDVDAAFANVTTLKYLQTLTLRGVALCAYPAGHSLGGCVWRLVVGAEEVVYASHWNNRQERHLPPADLGQLARPSVLIAHAGCAQRAAPPPRPAREKALCDAAAAGALAGGLALLPAPAAGRALELTLALEHHWEATPALAGVRVCLLSPVAPSVLEFAATQLEWMSADIANRFQQERANPFAPMRHVIPVASLRALDAMPPAPTVVVASLPSLGAGPARHLLARVAANPRACIIFPGTGGDSELARALADAASIPPQLRPELPLVLGSRLPLDGPELGAWREQRRKQAEAVAQQQAEAVEAAARLQAKQDAEALRQQQDAQPEAGGALAESVAPGTAGRMPGVGACLCDGFVPPPGCLAPVFPFEPMMAQASEYGDVVTAADFADAAGGGHLFEDDTALQEDSAGARAGLRAPGDAGVAEEVPTKVVVATLNVPLLCSIHSVDFAGLADGRSLRNTLQAMRPRRCVLLGGSAADHAALAAGVEMDPSPMVAVPGERLDLSAATPSFLVSLEDSLADIELAQAGAEGAYHVGWLDAVLDTRVGDGKPHATLKAFPEGGEPGAHTAARVGDARLSDLLTACAAAGIPAQFSAGGVLIAAGGVTVRKGDDDQLLLEGSLSDDYYRVMAVINAQFQVV